MVFTTFTGTFYDLKNNQKKYGPLLIIWALDERSSWTFLQN